MSDSDIVSTNKSNDTQVEQSEIAAKEETKESYESEDVYKPETVC